MGDVSLASYRAATQGHELTLHDGSVVEWWTRSVLSAESRMETQTYEQGVDCVFEPSPDDGGYSRGRPSIGDFC